MLKKSGLQIRTRGWFLMVFFTALLISSKSWSTPGFLVIQADLKSSPTFDSEKITTLNKGDTVDIKQRKLGWYQVETHDKNSGWVTLLQLRLERAEQPARNGQAFKFISLRRGHSDITATTGVRGIGENDIKNAKANFEALDTAKKYLISPNDAKKFAKEIPLNSQTIIYEEKKNDN